MSWQEAYARTAKGALTLIAMYLIGVISIAIGIGLVSTDNWFGTLIGLALGLAGVLVILLGIIAVWIKLITDSIVDNVKTDLSAQIWESAGAVRPSATAIERYPDSNPQSTHREN